MYFSSRVFIAASFSKCSLKVGQRLLKATASQGRLLAFSTAASEEESESHNRQLQEEEEQYEEDIKLKILDASLPHVGISGWSRETLLSGANSLGYPGVTHGLFPRGGVELVHHFYRSSNAKLISDLEKKIADQGQQAIKGTSKFLRDAIQERLLMNTEHIVTGRWIEAMGLMALPPNAIESLKCLFELTDGLWYLVGDTSSDMTWYTKRAVLGAVYKSTEFHMIQDRSNEYEQTWEFLDRQMERIKMLKVASEQFAQLPFLAKGLLRTAINIVAVQNNGFQRRG